jgi:hypothetical protein
VSQEPSESPTAALVLSDVPDKTFRDYLEEHADTDGDGALSQDEVDAVTEIGTVSDDGTVTDRGLSSLGVTDLTGIDVFTNLQTLVCADNEIRALDVSKNTHLTKLVCSTNQITTLTLPSSDGLSVLEAGENSLSSIDLSAYSSLQVVRLDSTVTVTGREAHLDQSALDKVNFMTSAFLNSVDGNGIGIAGYEMSTTRMSLSDDATLIFNTIYPHQLNIWLTPTLGAENPFGLKYSETGDATKYFVPLDTGKVIFQSFFGSVPDDLSSVENESLKPTVGGWLLQPADGAETRIVEMANLVSYGKILCYDCVITYWMEDTVYSTKYYRVQAISDSQSIFGYHLLTVEPLSGCETEFPQTEEWLAEQ